MLTALILIGSKPGPLGGEDAGQHLVQAVAPRELAETLRVERVEADVDAPQPGVEKRLGLLGEQDAVGGQAEVADAGNGGRSSRTRRGRSRRMQRLAAGQANLVDAQRAPRRGRSGRSPRRSAVRRGP